MNIAIYTRVSTDKQDPQMQDRELREYCERRNWTIVGTYTDAGVSGGTKESRPELNRMMADAKRRKFDAVLCWKFDRIGRSLRHLVNLRGQVNGIRVTHEGDTERFQFRQRGTIRARCGRVLLA